MNTHTPIEMIELVAADLASLCEEVVFVGGAIVALLITDPAAPPVSSTKDVDIVVSVATNYEYSELGGRLRGLGFSEDSDEGAPMCRWRRTGGLKLDVMPIDPKILNFSNRWFPLAFATATRHPLPSGREIRVVTAPCFLGTKLEAFHSRGNGDYQGSKDIEDLLAVIHGRESILSEIKSAPMELRDSLSAQFERLLESDAFQIRSRAICRGRIRRWCSVCSPRSPR